MDQKTANLFEEFNEAARVDITPGLSDGLTIRPAQMCDVGALGRISADREGGDSREHSAGFRRALEDEAAGRSFVILVAEFDGEIIGFGKARYLDKERGTGVGASPRGWYLTGVVVEPRFRRQGVGSRLTGERLRWIAQRSSSAYYFSNARNRVSIELHRGFGFVEVARSAEFAGVSFVGGQGVLYRADLTQSAWRGA